MGYTTEFNGDLKFTCKMTPEMFEHLNIICGEDVRDHKDWKVPQDSYGPAFYHIDIETNRDNSGIQWNGTEKSYSMEKQVEFTMEWMKEKYSDFGLVGVMEAQGEEVGDHWFLVADYDRVLKVEAEDWFVNYKNKITQAMISCSQNIEVSIT
jgi:hypothetical protein